MAHSTTWNASYEAIPANGDDASEGALRIRNLKRDVKERLALDHIMDETDSDGLHKQITFDEPLGADPADVANQGMLYTKDVSSVVELFWKDESGNVVQITSSGFLKGGYPHSANDEILIRPDATAGVATGWSTEAFTNKGVRLNSSAVHSTADGGTNTFSATFGTETTSSDGSHTHGAGTLNVNLADSGNDGAAAGAYNLVDPGSVTPTGATASGGAHTHTLDMNLQYKDFRVVSKD